MCEICGEITGEAPLSFGVPLDHWNVYDFDGASAAFPTGGTTVRDHTALLTGDDAARWNALASEGTPAVVTYRFYDVGSLPSSREAGPDFRNDGFFAFDERQKESFRAALEEFAETAGFLFVELDADDDRAMVGVNRTTGSDWGRLGELPLCRIAFRRRGRHRDRRRGQLRPGLLGVRDPPARDRPRGRAQAPVRHRVRERCGPP